MLGGGPAHPQKCSSQVSHLTLLQFLASPEDIRKYVPHLQMTTRNSLYSGGAPQTLPACLVILPRTCLKQRWPAVATALQNPGEAAQGDKKNNKIFK